MTFYPYYQLGDKITMKQKTITKTYLYFDEDEKKKFKKWLIDKNLFLGVVADKLEVSSAYLWLVINGQREVTKKLKEKLEALGYEM